MKPTRNRVFCKDCERVKMLFETEKQASNFMKFNREEIAASSGYSPQRSYYCLVCGGWHVTSIKDKISATRKELLYEQYTQEKERNRIEEAKTMEEAKKAEKEKKAEELNLIMEELENRISQIEESRKEQFFAEEIGNAKKEIELAVNANAEKDKLKELRKRLEVLYVIRKRHGFQEANRRSGNKLKTKEEQEWVIWYEKNKDKK